MNFILQKSYVRGDSAILFISAVLIATTTLHTAKSPSLFSSITFAISVISVHLLTVVTLTVMYRISPFHPLWNFPGPLINKVSSLKLFQVVWSGKRHDYIYQMHEKYGTFVRTGPNTLSINTHSAINPLYASANAMEKSLAYRPGRLHGDGLFFQTRHFEHTERRRLIAGAFSPSNISGWTSTVEKRTQEFLNCISDRIKGRSGTLELSEAIRHWSYDIMGELTFGGAGNFELMRDGDSRGLVRSGEIATMLFECFGEIMLLRV